MSGQSDLGLTPAQGVQSRERREGRSETRRARAYAAERKLGRDRFEFQMLYGIRRDLQASLVADGYRMRIYLPFGRQWFPYFMRRLGERPANVGFVLGAVFKER